MQTYMHKLYRTENSKLVILTDELVISIRRNTLILHFNVVVFFWTCIFMLERISCYELYLKFVNKILPENAV